MHADLPLIVTLASAFGLALLLGVLATRLRHASRWLAIWLAGVLIGPHHPGLRRRRGARARNWPRSA
jgi:CPA2 family monovalent cation:H+ antiporter-2